MTTTIQNEAELQRAMSMDSERARDYAPGCAMVASAGPKIYDLDDTIVPINGPSGCPWAPEADYAHSDDVWSDL